MVVNHGHKRIAFINSFLIGTVQLTLYKLAPNATGVEIAAYLLGGPFGIVCSMVVFKWFRTRQENTHGTK